MKRWLVVAAIVLASAAAYVQAGREQQQGASTQAQAGRGGRGQGGGGGRGVVSTADLTVLDGWGRPLTDPLAGGKPPGPAPARNIAGMWEPANGPGAGIQANGPASMPSDGKSEPP